MESLKSVFVAVLLAQTCSATTHNVFKGFTYTSYSNGTYSTNASDVTIQQMYDTGIRATEIMFTYYVFNSVNATAIFADPNDSPSDADIKHAIVSASRAGIAVALKPHIDCQDGIWRANIGTHFTTEQQWAEFFANYSSYINHAIDIAIGTGVPLAGFNVGTELDGTHHREAEWRAVIAGVRQRIPGVPLWLGPNWGWQGVPGYTLVAFWDALDYLGVDMYAPLANHDDPTLAEAVEGWAPLVANLTAFWQTHGSATKGFIFAEMGYASFQGAATNAPSCCSGPPDPATQAILYESFFQAVWPQPWMAGAFWWSWPSGLVNGDPCGTGFDVFRKPAADVLKKYYGAGKGTSPIPAKGLSYDALLVRPITSASPVTVYTNGTTTWDNWSYGASVDLVSAVDPYPAHTASAAVTVQSGEGALSLHYPAGLLDVSGFTVLSMDVIVPNASMAYEVYASVCGCTDCTNCYVQLPNVQLVLYTAEAQPCTLASDWASNPSLARVQVPLSALMPSDSAANGTIARLQVNGRAQAGAPCSFKVDNIAFA